ncbi:MAG: PHP domain-containing protein [Clostridia bacterium]|nr:PHP domain-containing protein [Clostridia bacterium]
MKKGVNLHCHSTCSDGEFTPEKLMEMADKNGIRYFAISDHDTILAYKEYAKKAKNYNINLINAIEFNVDEFKVYHFIAFGICNLDYVETFMKNLKEHNEAVCFKTLEKLKEHYNIDLDLNFVKSFSKDGVIDKRCIVNAMQKLNIIQNTYQGYTDYIGSTAKAYVPLRKLKVEEVIDLVHSCGGVICWAHPCITRHKNDNKLFSLDEIRQKARELKKIGLDGIEVYTAFTTAEEEACIDSIAKELGLARVGGSDFHRTGDKFCQENLKEENYLELVQKIKQRHKIYYNQHLPTCLSLNKE